MRSLIAALTAAGALGLAGMALAQQKPPLPTQTTGGTAGITTQVPDQNQQAADKAAAQLQDEKAKAAPAKK